MATLLPGKFTDWLNDRQKQLMHRQLLVISGPAHYVESMAKQVINSLPVKSLASVGFDSDESDLFSTTMITNKSYRQYLGHEFDSLVYNGFSGIRANAMMALSGTVKAGGLMVLLCPDLDEWPNVIDPQKAERTSYGYEPGESDDRFVKWLAINIRQTPDVAILSESGFEGIPSLLTTNGHSDSEAPYKSQCQKEAVTRILSVLSGHRKRPLVLTADRGRGKSSSLGIAAGLLAQQGKQLDIVITAPRFSATEQIFHHARKISPDLSSKGTYGLENPTTRIRFEATDALLANEGKGDLLFIDEAAALPYDIISRLTEKFSRVVFSTTLHGYEGSGRGFEIRFKGFLNRNFPGWKGFHLETPIRWAQDDSLEKFWFRTMLMDEQKPETPDNDGNHEEVIHKVISPDQLLAQPRVFKLIFQLLVNAHYQTEPDDLVRLLDSDDVTLFIGTKGDTLVSVALVSEEGGQRLSSISEDLASGTRRPRGHLLAQNLAYSFANPELATQHYWRIVRIAVNPDLQRLGYASLLLQAIRKRAEDMGIDMLGTSFGLTTELFDFWQKNDYLPVKIGYKRDAASGEQNLVMVSPLSPAANDFAITLKEDFTSELYFQMSRQLNTMEPELLSRLTTENQPVPLNKCDRRLLDQFCAATRPVYTCERAMLNLIKSSANSPGQNEMVLKHKALILAAVAQCRSVDDFKAQFQLTGKKQLEAQLRKAVAALLPD